ncbi:hypothetical protein J1605_013512 [Eschrichtius robustus]|uniref:Importin-9 n=1 Tax=Eschrichtius robustus TaxID=9764 RepID=A0AB34GGW0_ESCRO|nr:hypothetical protein J1605_013512 [Eschrichtius robustus]
MAAAAAAGAASGLPGPVAQGLKEALVDTLTGILSPVQEVRAAAEEQIKVLEAGPGEVVGRGGLGPLGPGRAERGAGGAGPGRGAGVGAGGGGAFSAGRRVWARLSVGGLAGPPHVSPGINHACAAASPPRRVPAGFRSGRHCSEKPIVLCLCVFVPLLLLEA